MASVCRLIFRLEVLTMTIVLPSSCRPMRVKSFSSEMNRGQNSELAKFFMLMRSAMSSVCPTAKATSMAKGSSEELPTTTTSDGLRVELLTSMVSGSVWQRSLGWDRSVMMNAAPGSRSLRVGMLHVPKHNVASPVPWVSLNG